MRTLPTETMIALRDDAGNAFMKDHILKIEVTGHNGVSITGVATILIHSVKRGCVSFALNQANKLFVTGVGSDGISLDYIQRIEKTQPELTENILLLYKNYQKNITHEKDNIK
jgi:hypothetical protein